MRRLMEWFRSWFALAGAYRRLTAAERECEAADKLRRESLRRLDERREDLLDLQERINSLMQAVEGNVREAERSHRQHEVALESLRAELRVARDVTVPTLVAAHKLILQRYDSETQIQVRRGVAALPGRDE